MSQQINNIGDDQDKKKRERAELQRWFEEFWGAELESLAPVETDEEHNKEGQSNN